MNDNTAQDINSPNISQTPVDDQLPQDHITPPQNPINPAPPPPSKPTPPLPPPPPRPALINTTGIKMKMPPILWKQTQDVLKELEQELGGPVLGYFTNFRITGEDVKYFYTHLASIGYQEKLFFILYTSGGDGTSAYRIASLLRAYCKELVIVIPEKAASAGTMLSLSGDTLMMTPLSYLTAVDTSVGHPLNPKDAHNRPVTVGLEEVRNAVEVLEKNSSPEKKTSIYETMFTYIHPVAYGNIVRTSSLSERLCRQLLDLRQTPPDETSTSTLINMLNHELPAHGYPITRDIAKNLGLPVVNASPKCDALLWQYINLNRAITEEVYTDISDSHQHKETILNIIESVGRRLAVRNSFDRRLDPIVKGWITLKDIYKWEAVHDIEENGEKKTVIESINF